MERAFLEGLSLGEEAIASILAESQKDDEAHRQELSELIFRQQLEKAIGEKKGRSVEAIQALLDVEALKGAEDRETRIRTALDGLKREKGFLFEDGVPAYAPGPGTGAYHHAYTQEELGRMSMAEYRAYRRADNVRR